MIIAGALLALGAAPLSADTICQKYQGGKAAGCRGDDQCRHLNAYPFWECVPRSGLGAYAAVAVGEGAAAQNDLGLRVSKVSGFAPLFYAAEGVTDTDAKSLRLKIDYYTRAIQAWQSSDGVKLKAAAYANRGFAYGMLKVYDKAENDFKVATQNDQYNPLPYNYLGHLYYTKGELLRAAEKFEFAFKLGLDDQFPGKTSSEAHRLHDAALRILEAQRLAEAKAKADKERLEREKLERERILAEAEMLAKAQNQLKNQAAQQGNRVQQPFQPTPAPTRPSVTDTGDIRPPEEAQPKTPSSDWARYCIIGLFLTTAVFLFVTYLVLKSDQNRIRQELGPLAKELGVDVKWMYFGFFIPPDTELHGKLMVTLVMYSVVAALGIGIVMFTFPIQTALKILSGPLISGVIMCLSVFGSYSLKTGVEGRSAPLASQTTWTPAAAPADYKPTYTEGTVLPDVPIPPEVTGRSLRSSASRARQIKMLIDSGSYKEALELFSKKSPLKITDADKDQLFEIYVRLGDFDRAGNLFDSLKGGALLAENLDRYEAFAAYCLNKNGKDLARRICRGLFETMKVSTGHLPAGAPTFYKLATFCEGAGDVELARDIFKHMADSGWEKFKDAGARHEELKTKLVVSVAPPQASVPAVQASGAGGGGDGVIGQVLNNQYELKGELGEGGMAKVYEGLDRKTRKKVAVKKMHPWLKKFPEEHKRFVQEAKIVSRLTHPNIVGVQAIVEQAGEIYLVFDYVDGKTLADVLKEKGLMQFQEIKKIFKGICEAVRYAHKASVIHRDLKPSNIMITKEGQALVMDFGLASELRESLTRVTHQTTSGTPAYMAPEQYVGIVKRESDIYAMGVCLYEMLTGKLPFTTGDIMQLKNDRNFRPASAELPWLPAGVDDIISRALAPEPSQRYADPMDIFDALDAL